MAASEARLKIVQAETLQKLDGERQQSVEKERQLLCAVLEIYGKRLELCIREQHVLTEAVETIAARLAFLEPGERKSAVPDAAAQAAAETSGAPPEAPAEIPPPRRPGRPPEAKAENEKMWLFRAICEVLGSADGSPMSPMAIAKDLPHQGIALAADNLKRRRFLERIRIVLESHPENFQHEPGVGFSLTRC